MKAKGDQKPVAKDLGQVPSLESQVQDPQHGARIPRNLLSTFGQNSGLALSMTLPVELPDELWLLIAVRVNKRDAQNLYLVKQSLLEHARDLRYKEISLLPKSRLSLEDMIAYNKYLQKPEISQRIQILTIDSSCIAKYDPEEYSRGLRLLNKLSSKRNRVVTQKRVLLSLAYQTLRDLINLHTLTIHNRSSERPVYVSLVSSSWRQRQVMAGGNPLRHLRLHFAVNGFQELLPEPESSNVEEDWRVMVELESLEIQLYPNDSFSDAAKVASNSGQARLAALLNLLTARRPPTSVAAMDLGSGHQNYDIGNEIPKLRTLTHHFSDIQTQSSVLIGLLDNFGTNPLISKSSQSTAPSRLYIPSSFTKTGAGLTLDHDVLLLPKLTHLSVTTGGLIPNYDTRIRTLIFLAKTVTHLRISTHRVYASSLDLPPGGIFNDAYIAPALTSLEYLEIAGPRDPAHWGMISTVKAYLTRTELKQLRKLIFETGFPATYAELRYFFLGTPVKPVQPPLPIRETLKVSLSHIHSLSLSLITLTPGHLTLLSRFLPGLRRLSIRLWANQDQGPFRGSYDGNLDRPREEPRVHSWPSPILFRDGSVGLPETVDDRICMQADFVEELDRRLEGGAFDGWSTGQLEEIRISVHGMDNETGGWIEAALRRTVPTARCIRIGGDACAQESVFPPVIPLR